MARTISHSFATLTHEILFLHCVISCILGHYIHSYSYSLWFSVSVFPTYAADLLLVKHKLYLKKTLGFTVKSKAITRSSGCGGNMLPSMAFSFSWKRKKTRSSHLIQFRMKLKERALMNSIRGDPEVVSCLGDRKMRKLLFILVFITCIAHVSSWSYVSKKKLLAEKRARR